MPVELPSAASISFHRTILFLSAWASSVLFCSSAVLARSEGWPHHERTFSIYLCPLPFWLTFPWWVLSTSWSCPSRLCVVFLACVHLALFLALGLSLSPGNSLVSSWCDHSMLASLLLQSLIVPPLLQLCWGPTLLFLCCPRHLHNIFLSPFISKASRRFFILSKCPAFTAVHCYR